MYTFRANPLMLVAPLNTVYPAVFIILLLFLLLFLCQLNRYFNSLRKHCIKLPQPLRRYSGSFLYSQCIYFLFLRLIFLGLVLLANCKHGISVQVELDLKVSLLSKFFFRFSFQAVMLKQRELQLKAARSKNLVHIIPGMLHHKHLG